MFWRSTLPPLLILWLSASASQIAYGQSIQSPPHPNNYIVLVDASGSATKTDSRRSLYEKALYEDLVAGLYNKGFGQHIPPYDPQQDRLSLYHFGVDTGDVATAYRRLAGYDLLTDFIHPFFAVQRGVSPAQLKERLLPAQTYNYTLLSWAKQLALLRSQPSNPGEISQHTFMIVIHDGLPNDHSIKGEIEMLRRWSGDNYQRVNPLVASVNHNYRFTDGNGSEGTAWAEEIVDGTNEGEPFFIEAYEVVSAEQVEWESKGKRLSPLKDFRIHWTQEGGDTPRGVLTATLNEEFAEWVGASNASKVSLGVGQDSRLGAGEGLEVSFNFDGPLTCSPQTVDATLSILLRRSDPLVSTRTVIYTHQEKVTVPRPLHCSTTFALWVVLLLLLAVSAVLILAFYFAYRFRKTHLEIEIPGTLAPIRIKRRGVCEGRAPVVPQSELEALRLNLPGPFDQWLFYRGATVTLNSGGREEDVLWSANGGMAEVCLPLPQRQVLALWQHLPAEPTVITISFRQGRQHAQVRLAYPRALAESTVRSTVMGENTVYVALDLGSESMAAYYEDNSGNGGMIKLQAKAATLLGGGGTAAERPDLLMEETAGGSLKPSPRLWNRISFKDKAQPKEPKDDHAVLFFADSPELYKKSLFRFFHLSEEWPPPSGVMPNPKILFQQQVTDILEPIKVVSTEGDNVHVRLYPEFLIKHLTTQVLINFVLNSPELSRYEQKNIHLTITVPNVYSLPHAESIKEFVRAHSGDLAGVEVLSESDAVAYYALKAIDMDRDSADLKRFKEAWSEELERRRELCLVTIDVGKGTTDLSCVLVQEPPTGGFLSRLRGRSGADKQGDKGKRRRHSVQGKTGKSSGGNYLNYIFACYYDACLKAAAEERPLGPDQSMPFGFIKKPSNPKYNRSQLKALLELEKLIERIKRGMSEKYEINEHLIKPDEQRKVLKRVIDIMLEGVNENWRSASTDEQARYRALRSRAIEMMVLPSKLDPAGGGLSIKSLFSSLGRSSSGGEGKTDAAETTSKPNSPNPPSDGSPRTDVAAQVASAQPSAMTAQLKRDIEEYVKENVEELFDSLKRLVREHQAISSDRGNIDGGAFVVVSGQGSQFKPLREAIRRICKDIGINQSQVLMMEGVASKEACCKGVVNFWRAAMLRTNERELHGTYGCLDYVTNRFLAFDMKNIKNGGRDTIKFGVSSAYLVVFTPRSYDEIQERQPRLNDGATARIGYFEGESEFTLEYDPDRLELLINGKKLTIGGFGSPDGSIYKKVWPEILEPFRD